MKRMIVILLALLLVLQCACGKKKEENAMADAVQRRLDEAASAEKEAEEEETESQQTEQEEPEQEEPEESAEQEASAPEEPAESPKPDVAAECELLAEMMQTALIPLDWNHEYYEMVSAPVLATEPSALDGTWGYNPYAVSGVLVTDADDDGSPELILQAGEVEQRFYVFTVKDGAVHCVGFGLLENQNGEPFMTRYRDEQNGCTVLISEGESGSGAGNYQFLCWVDGRDLGCREADFCGFDEYSEELGFHKVYELLGEEISEEEFEELRSEFYASLTQVETLEFMPLGADPAGTAAQLLYLWAIER